jgi:hypothetical protein
MESSEYMSEHQRKEKEARPYDKYVPGIAQLEFPDPTQKQIANNKVE